VAMIDPASIPARLRRFPLWKDKYLIHYTVYVDEKGIPDFRVMNAENRAVAMATKACHLCGYSLGTEPMVFIGGPQTAEHHVFLDGPMHDDCARYAIQICPYLVSPTAHFSSPFRAKLRDAGIVANPAVDPERPAKMALVYCRDYELAKVDNMIGFHALGVSKIDWDTIPQRPE
jgi:hypothetical protein